MPIQKATKKHRLLVDIRDRNLTAALKLGLIDWFEFFERWRQL